jgi:hypothetical protein
MAELRFRLIANAGDWGSPLSAESAFETLEEAQAAGREYRAEQKRMGGPDVTGSLKIEETRPDGVVVTHPVA